MHVFRPNTAAVAAKVIDGEAIIMNLANGAYYSMSNVGAAVWEMIERGCSMEDLQNGVIRRYAVDPAQAREDVGRLVKDLLADDLIVAGPGMASQPPAIESAESRDTYCSPVLNKYTEMADLLALDPPMPVLPSEPQSGRAG